MPQLAINGELCAASAERGYTNEKLENLTSGLWCYVISDENVLQRSFKTLDI
jgi:hypothetical protein